MNGLAAEDARELRELIEANRVRALWWMPPDYFPGDADAACGVLAKIAARGDLATWKRARLLMQRLER